MAFEPQIPIGFQGQILAPEVIDPVGQQPSTIIRLNDPWQVRVRWEVTGLLAPPIAGTWSLRVLLESVGTHFEGQVGPVATVDYQTGGTWTGNTCQYDETINIPAGEPPDEGPYMLVVALLFEDSVGNPGPLAALEEGPLIQVFQD